MEQEPTASGPVEAPASSSNGNGGGPSYLELLRGKRQKLVAQRHIDLPVNGYDGMLVVRFGVMEPDLFARMMMFMSPGPNPPGADAIYVRALVETCVEVMVRRAPGLALESIDPDGGRCRFDARLAELMELPGQSAEEVCRDLYGGGGGIATAALAVFGFASDVSAFVDEELEGES